MELENDEIYFGDVNTNNTDNNKSSNKKNSKKILIAIVLLLLIGVIGFFLFFNKDKTNEVTLKIDENSTTTLKIKSGDKLSIPNIANKEGYEFVEWQLDGKKFDFNMPIKSDIELVAVWKKKSSDLNTEYYTVSFDSAGGSVVESQRVALGESALRPGDPIRGDEGDTKFVFSTWLLDGVEYNFGNSVTKDIVLVAKWNEIKNDPTIERFTVSFNANEGTYVTSQIINKGERASKPIDPTRIGYTFAGWQLNGSMFDFNTPITSNIDLIATWNKNEAAPEPSQENVTVSFNSDGGSEVSPQTINKGGKASKPSNPSWNGYTFIGWYLGDNAFDFNTSINDSITLVARWKKVENSDVLPTPKKFNVTFDSNGGSAVSSQTVTEGGKASKPNNPSKVGYNFNGWLLNGRAFDFNSTITANISLVASWKQKAFTVRAVAPDEFTPGRRLDVYADGAKISFDSIYYTDGTFIVSGSSPNVGSQALSGQSKLLVQLSGSSEKFVATIVN